MASLSAVLFLLPIAAYLLWVRWHPGEDLPFHVLTPVLAGLALGFACLVWYGLSATEDRGTAYVPARLENGEVVPGRAERAPPR